MKFYYPFTRVRNSPFLIILGSLIVSCARAQTPSNDVVVSQSSSLSSSASPSNAPRRRSFSLNSSDISNIDKLLLQLDRADQRNRDLASGLLDDAKRVAEQDRKEGLHGERSGLSKLFCGSAVEYPTVEALIGCAKSLALEDASFDVKVKRSQNASDIYQTTLEFSKRTKNSISGAERQKIENNIKCLDAFVKSPNPNSPGCELIKISLKKP